MSPRALGEHLADNRNVTLLVRLVTDPDGHLVRGELVGVDGANRGRFLSWDRLIELLSACIDPDAG